MLRVANSATVAGGSNNSCYVVAVAGFPTGQDILDRLGSNVVGKRQV
jgi:hypothetical protein